MRYFNAFATAWLATGVLGRDIPGNVQSFYDRVKNGKCNASTNLQDGFYDRCFSDDGPCSCDGSNTFAYCQDNQSGVIYIHGNDYRLANMDIDCDGDQSDPGDGRCGNSADTQSTTSFKSLVQQYSQIQGNYVSDLNANYNPYVVLGNSADSGKCTPYPTFNPQDYGVKPLSVMAVICNNQMFYGVWGDENGDDGPPLVGEASISLATACFGDGITGDNGHDQADVLYIAFPGSVADTVHKHAHWSSKSFQEFEDSISGVGDNLVARLSQGQLLKNTYS